MVYQTGQQDCGKAVVRNMAVLLFRDDSFQVLPLKEDCQDFYSMRKELERIGLLFVPYEIKSIDLVRKEQLPAVAQVRRGEGTHFVVVRRIGRRILLDDPEFGTYFLTKEEFLAEFLGKMLLKKTIGRIPKKPRISFFSKLDVCLFFLVFLAQFVSLFSAVFFMGEEKTLILSTVLLACYGVFAFLGFLLSLAVRRRMTKAIFLPYLQKTRVAGDGPILSAILDREVSKALTLVNYGVLLGILLTMFSFNGIFFAFLGILGVLMGAMGSLLQKETNYSKRYCARKEAHYFWLLGKSNTNHDDVFLDSERMAARYLTSRAFLSVLKSGVVGLAILTFMLFSEMQGLNFFLFNAFVTLGIGRTTERLVHNYVDDHLECRDINSLSFPLPSFLLNIELSLGYTNRKNGGADRNGRKKNP